MTLNKIISIQNTERSDVFAQCRRMTLNKLFTKEERVEKVEI